MTCQYCGYPQAYRVKRPKQGIIQTVCERCGRHTTVKMQDKHEQKGIEEPVCRG